MASYVVNERAVAHARRLIRGGQYVLVIFAASIEPGSSRATTAPPNGATKEIELAAHDLLQLFDSSSA